MRIGIDMGHSLNGAGSGAIGIVKETDKNRLVGKALIALLEAKGHTVINCTVGKANSTNEQLQGITNKANAQTLDLFLSIHLNSFNGQAHGVETIVYPNTNVNTKAMAKKVQDSLVKEIGWTNRGVKESNLFVLRNTKAPAILVELGFCDNVADMQKWNTDKIVKAIFEAITGQNFSTGAGATTNTNATVKGYSKRDFIIDIQRAIGASVDGIAGQETLSKTVTLSKTKNITHAAVKPVQKYLNELGFNCGVADGIAGQQFHNAVIAYQKSKGLYADGEITARNVTWKKLLGL